VRIRSNSNEPGSNDPAFHLLALSEAALAVDFERESAGVQKGGLLDYLGKLKF
jgi:hypothetical protein